VRLSGPENAPRPLCDGFNNIINLLLLFPLPFRLFPRAFFSFARDVRSSLLEALFCRPPNIYLVSSQSALLYHTWFHPPKRPTYDSSVVPQPFIFPPTSADPLPLFVQHPFFPPLCMFRIIFPPLVTFCHRVVCPFSRPRVRPNMGRTPSPSAKWLTTARTRCPPLPRIRDWRLTFLLLLRDCFCILLPFIGNSTLPSIFPHLWLLSTQAEFGPSPPSQIFEWHVGTKLPHNLGCRVVWRPALCHFFFSPPTPLSTMLFCPTSFDSPSLPLSFYFSFAATRLKAIP